jgi:hypothetical protein
MLVMTRGLLIGMKVVVDIPMTIRLDSKVPSSDVIQWYPTLKTNWINGDIMGILLNKRITWEYLGITWTYHSHIFPIFQVFPQ